MNREEMYHCIRVSATRISRLDMSNRLYRALEKNHVETIGDILLHTPREIHFFRNLGDKSYYELMQILVQVLGQEIFDCWLDEGRTR